MIPVVAVIPIYKPELTALEHYSVRQSVNALQRRPLYFIGPENLQRNWYTEHFPQVGFAGFDPTYFASLHGYNLLLLNRSFYARFLNCTFVLIVQPDAIVFEDALDHWTAQPFDYVGAPWPKGLELFINAGKFHGDCGKRIKVLVGNGGLSLRRVSKCIALLDEFEGELLTIFQNSGSSEDLFFSFMGACSEQFVMPNEFIAARFSLEVRPSFYFSVNGGRLPMGAHAWWSNEPEFWRPHLPGSPPLPAAA